MSYSSNNRTFDPTALPPRWLDCPRKSTIISERFIAFKTPLDDRFKDKIDIGRRWPPSMLVNSFKNEPRKLGLVIDLTNTERFYSSETEFIQKNIRYKKIRCRGHGETPNNEQITQFIETCTDFFEHHPNEIIGVHCTHGFNRTGFLICSYLCKELDMSIDAAINLFAIARPTGIYKQDYLDELLRLYGDEEQGRIMAPPRPDWCATNSDDEDEPNERPVAGGGGIKRPRDSSQNSFDQTNKRTREETPVTQNPDAQFAVSGLPGVNTVMLQSTKTAAQLTIQRMCDWHRNGFPGSQPVSMDVNNYQTIVQSPYMVSWKADGTRYMMLIEDEKKIYMFDRDNTVFEVSSLPFPKDPDYTKHLTNTLVDGELVIDSVNGEKIPRYLIYDIIIFEGDNVGKRPFRERLDIIRESIVNVRNKAVQRGRFDKLQDAFSVRMKEFYDLSKVAKLLSTEFRSQIGHEMDGLIFQPELDPYVPGRSPHVLKWKEDNTIDFRLKICTDRPQLGCLPQKKAFLYVNGMKEPFSKMTYTQDLRKYDGKIIECTFQNKQWRFLRERTDKSYPNAKETAFGAITAANTPITPLILCSMIDEHLKHPKQ